MLALANFYISAWLPVLQSAIIYSSFLSKGDIEYQCAVLSAV